ncbi:hypothetical protein LEP1GSC021_4611 [Leptospira noguchii str. 1993005606]|uniref:Uncharacterized protein n=1 Tax=Leptospira noguchii str. 2007001578 TaxID=1049974 RepID=A0ABN0J2C8_9LEPT|nr:hypothetical protein LEP1GSC035_1382 [Leptospira noguchii str. 2007001578]EPE84825.1 hypothetical protein LEP1GSC021_4611 [Leptospira noguchii str. 1993005606]
MELLLQKEIWNIKSILAFWKSPEFLLGGIAIENRKNSYLLTIGKTELSVHSSEKETEEN